MAPPQHVEGINVPGQVDDQAPGRNILGKDPREVDRSDLLLDVADALSRPGQDFFAFVRKIKNGDVLIRHPDVLEENRQGALADGTEPKAENFVIEGYHAGNLL
ncbi:MAG: hypothetical protein BWY44_00094 [Candidatus Omnitrophica bacterium ADurb.Bin292]|nr:MAG: hypothetical protein BWY44_00094 [Candidatus Omnitrophica bacterium ADurb.Bin292]